MDKLLAAFKARWAERSTRIALITIALSGAVGLGWLTWDQAAAYADKALAMITMAGLLANAITPDNNRAVDAAAAVDEMVDHAVAVATEAAEKAAGPGAREASLAVSKVVEKLGL